jgi:hypothetical protein
MLARPCRRSCSSARHSEQRLSARKSSSSCGSLSLTEQFNRSYQAVVTELFRCRVNAFRSARLSTERPESNRSTLCTNSIHWTVNARVSKPNFQLFQWFRRIEPCQFRITGGVSDFHRSSRRFSIRQTSGVLIPGFSHSAGDIAQGAFHSGGVVGNHFQVSACGLVRFTATLFPVS